MGIKVLKSGSGSFFSGTTRNGGGWLAHSRWLFPCSLSVPCPTSACFIYTYSGLPTYLPWAPASDCSYQRDGEVCAFLLVSLVIDEPIWHQLPCNWQSPPPPGAKTAATSWRCMLHRVGGHSRTLLQTQKLPICQTTEVSVAWSTCAG